MKYAIRWAGLFGSGAFALLSYTAFLGSFNPEKALFLGLCGAVVAGFCGYHMGDIFSHPKGRRRKPALPGQLPGALPAPAAQPAATSTENEENTTAPAP